MDYDGMSDFEISRLVAESVGLYWHMNPSHRLNYSGSWCYGEEPKDKSIIAVSLPDYCNEPESAWPIIIESKINIDFRESISAGPMCRVSGKSELYHVDKNPLRAAMIAYLKMKEGE